MTIQVLPVKQIGITLSQEQWTEEVPHTTNDGSKSDLKPVLSPFLPAVTNANISVITEQMAMVHLHVSSTIPSNHSIDVVSPPPDL
ncbi:hypothetical protein [Aridibaculum aurantiacum]|uniref:hypothetical protein n=1 Tax=Aridibaculum aurantiacum TaxID=2810307 RepID=UPI001A97139C|nr:hypothetical protein [Aridibaculum aurantiacum]